MTHHCVLELLYPHHLLLLHLLLVVRDGLRYSFHVGGGILEMPAYLYSMDQADISHSAYVVEPGAKLGHGGKKEYRDVRGEQRMGMRFDEVQKFKLSIVN